MSRPPSWLCETGILVGTVLLAALCAAAQLPECTGRGTWETRAPFPIEATEVAAAAIGTRVYVLGGFLPSGASSNRMFVYEAQRDTWAERAPLPIEGGVNHANLVSAGSGSA